MSSTDRDTRDWIEAHCLVVGGGTPTGSTTLMQRVEESGAHKVVLYVHGGLVTENEGFEVARDLAARIGESEGIYPVFLVWRTGPLEVLPRLLWTFLTEPKVVIPLLRWVFKLLGVDPVSKAIELAQQQFESLEPTLRGPMDQIRRPLLDIEATDAESDLAALMVLDEHLTAGIAHTRQRRDTPFESGVDTPLSREFMEGLGKESPYEGIDPAVAYLASKAIQVARQVWARRGSPSWHGWRDTAIEELVRTIGVLHVTLHKGWAEMKRMAAAAYDEDSSPGRQLARELADWENRAHERELHIVAHSAGSFHAGHLLDALKRGGATHPIVRSLHLMAPACDHDFALERFARTSSLVSRQRLYLLRKPFEDDEGSFSWTTDTLGTIRFYDGSLLNLLSGLLEPAAGWPVLGLERWMVRGQHGSAVRALFDDVLLAPTPSGHDYPGRCDALTHGAFDDEEHTWVSVLDVVTSGRTPVAPIPRQEIAEEAAPAVAPHAVAMHVDSDTESLEDDFGDEALWAANLEDGDHPLPPSGAGEFEAVPSVCWAEDARNIDLAHLPEAPEGPEFWLDVPALGRLLAASRFTHVTDELVLFGLRGCQLTSDGTHTAWAPTLALRFVLPDHESRRCVIGLWNRVTGEICGFEGSTVPDAGSVQAAAMGSLRANLLPTGAYRYRVGKNRKVPGVLRIAESEIVVLRQPKGKSPAGFSTSDDFAPPAFVADNLHPAFRTGPTFSSAGCQTVAGSYSDGEHKGPWAELRQRAGVSKQGPRRWWYFLWTGREAHVASHAPDQLPTVLRMGSRGEEVRAVQAALGVGADGVFGPRTMHAFTTWRRLLGEPASSVLIEEMLPTLGVALQPSREMPKARVAALDGGASEEVAVPPVVAQVRSGQPEEAASSGQFQSLPEPEEEPEEQEPARRSVWGRLVLAGLMLMVLGAVAVGALEIWGPPWWEPELWIQAIRSRAVAV